MGRELKGCALLICLLFVSLTIASQARDSCGTPETREGEGPDPFCQFNFVSVSGDYTIGEEVEFLVLVRNTYTGTKWTDPDSSLKYRLYFAKLSILDRDVTDKNGNEKSVIEENRPNSMRPDNNNGQGYNISNGNSWYYYLDDDNSDPLSFRIKRTGVKLGDYRLPVLLNFQVGIRRNPSNPSIVDMSEPLVQEGYVTFSVKSNMIGISDSMAFTTSDGGTNTPLYAGSKYMTLTSPFIRPQMGKDLRGVIVNLQFQDAYFTVEKGALNFETMDYNSGRYFKWIIDTSPLTPPKTYKGSLIIDYVLDTNPIEEGPYVFEFRVEATPLIGFPDTQNMTIPTFSVIQKSERVDIKFNVRNNGNVPLKELTVRLDLDAASFLSQGGLYFDEGDGRYKSMPLERTYSDLAVEDGVMVEFKDVKLDSMLPPGNYLIPIDYSARYIDPFDDSGANIRLETAQWDELGKDDYMRIRTLCSDPRPKAMLAPHLMMRVVDDLGGADISAKPIGSLTKGDRGANFSIEVGNMEMYPLKNALYRLGSEKPGVVWKAGSPGNAIVEEGHCTIPASLDGNPGTQSISGRVDVASNTSAGTSVMFLELSGVDLDGDLLSFNFTFDMKIEDRSAQIEFIAFTTAEMVPEKEFDVTVRFMNIGMTGIRDYRMILCSESNWITVTKGSAEGIDLGPGQTGTHVFKCVASENLEYGTVCDLKIYVSYVETDGVQRGFDQNDERTFQLSSVKAPEDEAAEPLSVVGGFVMAGLILGGLLIAISILLSMLIVSRSVRMINSSPGKDPSQVKTMDQKQVLERTAVPDLSPPIAQPSIPGPGAVPGLPKSPAATGDPFLDEVFSNRPPL